MLSRHARPRVRGARQPRSRRNCRVHHRPVSVAEAGALAGRHLFRRGFGPRAHSVDPGVARPMNARFKLDENLPRDAEALLRGAGFGTETVLSERLGGAVDPIVPFSTPAQPKDGCSSLSIWTSPTYAPTLLPNAAALGAPAASTDCPKHIDAGARDREAARHGELRGSAMGGRDRSTRPKRYCVFLPPSTLAATKPTTAPTMKPAMNQVGSGGTTIAGG